MKFGLDIAISGHTAHPQNLANLAAEAEESGWDGFFVWDIFFGDEMDSDPNKEYIGCYDPYVTLAVIAMKT